MYQSGTCSLAMVQHCLELLTAPAAASRSQDDAADAQILQNAAAVATFGVLRRYAEQAVLRVQAAIIVVQPQLWVQKQMKATKAGLPADQVFLDVIMLAVAATGITETAADRYLQQVLAAVLVFDAINLQTSQTCFQAKDDDCVTMQLHTLE